ncbi:hypothetical protein TNCV_4091801 [Trichonephila clavipes]|nr:hypothetical protein TNCV_4091801 [Trichonephila clavipes]
MPLDKRVFKGHYDSSPGIDRNNFSQDFVAMIAGQVRRISPPKKIYAQDVLIICGENVNDGRKNQNKIIMVEWYEDNELLSSDVSIEKRIRNFRIILSHYAKLPEIKVLRWNVSE